jgi:hypothetical protein
MPFLKDVYVTYIKPLSTFIAVYEAGIKQHTKCGKYTYRQNFELNVQLCILMVRTLHLMVYKNAIQLSFKY